MSNKKIISFTIGPVQSFISQARKTKDSFSGSNILSDIIHETIKSLDDGEIIFPAKDIESKPNRFIAIIDTDTDEDAIITRFSNIAKQKYRQIAENTYFKVFDKNDRPIGFDEQIEDFLDIYWLTLDYREDDYKSIYKELDSQMGAIKNTRICSQISYLSYDDEHYGKKDQYGERGKKCSICGERNGIFYSKENEKFCKLLYHRIVENKLLSNDELLCAVCFTKRFYEIEKTESFPSTSEISLMNIDFPKEKESYWELEKEYNIRFSYDLLYDENINANYMKDNIVQTSRLEENKMEELIEELKLIRNKIEAKGKKDVKKLSKYYAVISFDGDSMGKWLTGDKIDESKISIIEYHKKLSACLGKFSLMVRSIIDESEDGTKKGKTIYAGGEDFLGYINLQYLFEVMKELRESFEEVVNKPLKPYYIDENENLTFSAGISIAHYKTTLSNVIIWAKKMESKAKEIESKNAFAIALLKRSGEILIIKYRWQETGKDDFGLLKDIQSIIDEMKGGYFSSSFVYSLSEMVNKFADKYSQVTIENKTIISQIMKSEIKRTVTRSADKERLGDKYDKSIEKLTNTLISIYDRDCHMENLDRKENNFINLLFIIIFLIKEVYHDNRD